ncbi:putative DNA polymerase III, gamma/tau subunits [Leptospirillum ferriphilum ML-04]|nr:putative DNA polymerase III, gamma/tau subunits [Leptospirillum ferriphilum ML-04]
MTWFPFRRFHFPLLIPPGLMSTILSLARKWRPQLFSDLVGQEFVVRALTGTLGSGKLPQALLFSGDRGVGKTTVARILAKAINCEKGPTVDPCQECDSCLEITRGTSPDVLEIDGASHTGVEDIRSLREGIRYLPFRSRSRVYIIDEVHMLSQAAFNALLKTLEEPPPHVVFIFATTEDHKIPDTILSRCQHFRFRSLGVPEITAKLENIVRQESLSFPRAILNLIARASGGSLRDALSLLDQIRFLGDTPRSVEETALFLGMAGGLPEKKLLDSLLEGNLKNALENGDRMLAMGIDPRATLRSLASKVRDLLMSSLLECPLTDPRFAWDESEVPETPLPGAFFLEQMLSLLLEGEMGIRKSPQPSITFLLFLCRIVHIQNILPLPEILDRLSKTGSSLPPGSSSRPASRPTVPNTVTTMQTDNPSTGNDPRIPSDWHQILEKCRDAGPTVLELLEHCPVKKLSAGHFLLKAPNAFMEKRIQEILPVFQEVVKKNVGIPFELVVSTDSADKSPEPDSSEALARNHPMVREAASLFGGEVIVTRKSGFSETSPGTEEKKE